MAYRKRSFKERLYEIIPGTMFWGTLFFALFFSTNHPAWVATFIILFDLFWLFRAVNTALHLVSSYRRYIFFVRFNWLEFVEHLSDYNRIIEFLKQKKLEFAKAEKQHKMPKADALTALPKKNQLSFAQKLGSPSPAYAQRYFDHEIARVQNLIDKGFKAKNYRDFYHLVIYPFVSEGPEILETSLKALTQANYPKDRMMVILASEERAGETAAKTAALMKDEFGEEFYKFFITTHPDGLPNEIKGKSANASWAVQAVMPELEKLGIDIDQVIVSNFDSDTMTHPEYFSRVMYEFLTEEKPYRRSYQPIAVYNNNIWDSPAIIRVVSVSNSFWQFTESSRPNRLRTFSSHSMTLRALVDIGFWKKDLVNEDGYVFWQCYFHYQGDYAVVPLFVSISLDTCLADTYKQTLINQYKQKRRWAYNVEYYPTLVPTLLKLKTSLWDRFYKLFQYVEGNYNWATASIVISALGWLPLVLGGHNFGDTVIALNLPFMTKSLMTMATAFLILSVYINMILLPPRPERYTKWRSVAMYAQWIIVPFISVIFGSLPAVEAHTRLMIGAYMEFWVTPKVRKEAIADVHTANMLT